MSAGERLRSRQGPRGVVPDDARRGLLAHHGDHPSHEGDIGDCGFYTADGAVETREALVWVVCCEAFPV